ncbi:hypothetical protein CP02DC21_1149, partial [Chlamydia psittaci 02DC21]
MSWFGPVLAFLCRSGSVEQVQAGLVCCEPVKTGLSRSGPVCAGLSRSGPVLAG